MSAPCLLLTRADIAPLMTPADYLSAVEAAFRAVHEGRATSPQPMHLAAEGGAFHAKGAAFKDKRAYAAVKLNGNFPGNPDRFGLPTIQGVIVLSDAANGRVLAVMDSIEITIKRTAAASALAARLLARPGASTLAIIGCGEQGAAHVEALLPLFSIARGLACDLVPNRAEAFARRMSVEHGVPFAATGVTDAAAADIIVTCTTARTPILAAAAPGAFIAAVGADNPDKNEIAPALMAGARVVADVLAQCAEMGDLRHALESGAMRESDVHGELAQVLCGARVGRSTADEMFVFDSTGTALQDVASAARVYERACAAGIGQRIVLA